MSRHHDIRKAYVFCDRPGSNSDFTEHSDPDAVRAFAFTKDMDWLSRLLAPLNVTTAEP